MLLSTHSQVVVSHFRFIFRGVIVLITDCCFTRLCIIVFVACGGSGRGRGQSRYHPIISLTATCQNRVAGIDARRSCDADIAKSISFCLLFSAFFLSRFALLIFSLQPGVRLMGVMMIGGIKRKEKRKTGGERRGIGAFSGCLSWRVGMYLRTVVCLKKSL